MCAGVSFIPWHMTRDLSYSRTLFGLFGSPCAGMRLHVREGVKKYDIHIKPKSYKFELLGELVI